MALIDKSMEEVVEALNIAAVQADGWLFEEIEIARAKLVLPFFERGQALASSLTSLRRWASPPERVGEYWPRVM